MEYTKDMIFQVHYGEVRNVIKVDKNRRTSRIWRALARHKIVTASVFSLLVFIGIDLILLAEFFQVLASY